MQRHFVTRKQISMPYMCYLGLIHIPWNFTALIDLSIFICLTSLHTSDWQRWMCLKLLNDTTRHNVCSSILQWQQTIEIYCIVTVFVWNHGWVIIENDCFTMILQAGYPRGSAVARGVKNLPSPHTQSFTTRQTPLNFTNNNNNLSEHHCHITSNRELLEITYSNCDAASLNRNNNGNQISRRRMREAKKSNLAVTFSNDLVEDPHIAGNHFRWAWVDSSSRVCLHCSCSWHHESVHMT